MFDEAPLAADAAAFAVDVGSRIDRRMWLRTALVSVLGLIGLLIAWLQFDLSPSDLNLSLSVFQPVAGPDNAGLWAAVILMLALGWVAIQSAASES